MRVRLPTSGRKKITLLGIAVQEPVAKVSVASVLSEAYFRWVPTLPRGPDSAKLKFTCTVWPERDQ